MHKQINYAEHYALEVCLRDGLSYRQISEKLGRSPNSWNYEVIANGGSRETYSAHLAQLSASLRKWQANSRNPAKDRRVWVFVLAGLRNRYSPEQISKKSASEIGNPTSWKGNALPVTAFASYKRD